MTRKGLLRDPAFPLLKEWLIARTGLAYFADRDEDLADRLTRRMARLAASDAAGYLARLQSPQTGAEELEGVTAELTIGETYFFRYHEQFEALRDRVIPELIERRSGVRQLRFWSAGCATGPEPYSLSILLKQHFASRLAGWNIQIVGTDLNHEFLDRARAACFGTWALRTLSEEQRSAAFVRDGEEWLLRHEYREGVSFARHNLVEDSLPCYARGIYGFDVILCRNVMIYFDRPTIAATVERLRGCLDDEGWLLVGHSEPNLEVFRSWELVPVPGATLYRNRTAAPPQSAEAAGWKGEGVLAWESRGGHPGGEVGSGRRKEPLSVQAIHGSGRPVAPPPPGLPNPPPLGNPGGPRALGLSEPASTVQRLDAVRPHAPKPETLEELRTLANKAQWEEAEDLCVKLESQERLNPVFHFYRALAAEGFGRATAAERCYRQALFLDRAFAPAHYHLGLLLEARGEFRQAERSYRNAAAILAKSGPDGFTAGGAGTDANELRRGVETRLARLKERESLG